jgi:hypothetical protein
LRYSKGHFANGSDGGASRFGWITFGGGKGFALISLDLL